MPRLRPALKATGKRNQHIVRRAAKHSVSFTPADARSCRLDAPSRTMHFPLGVVAVGGTLLWGGGPQAWRRVWGCPPSSWSTCSCSARCRRLGGGLPAPEAAGLSRGRWLLKAQLWPAGQRLSLSAKQVRRREGGRVDRLLN